MHQTAFFALEVTVDGARRQTTFFGYATQRGFFEALLGELLEGKMHNTFARLDTFLGKRRDRYSGHGRYFGNGRCPV